MTSASGTIERTNNEPDKYEVPAQKWADITDASGRFGVGIINDSKHGWDKPTDNTLRLTLIHTPRPVGGYTYQSSNDLGRHRFIFSIAGHAGRLAPGADAAPCDPVEPAARSRSRRRRIRGRSADRSRCSPSTISQDRSPWSR